MRLVTALIALAIPLGAIASSEVPTFPSDATVQRLDISTGSSITAPSRIAEFLRELRALPENWRRPIDTLPTPQSTVGFINSAGGLACAVWLGPNWLGSRCGLPDASRALMIEITPIQARYFRDVVGGKWEVK